jgi:hypothetical protein
MEWVSTRLLEAKARMKESGGTAKHMGLVNLQGRRVKRCELASISLHLFVAAGSSISFASG